MKKIICIALAAVMALSLAACGGNNGLSGKVATDGSTSMEKVIGALKETFEGENAGVEVTYNPTGSGSGIKAVQEGRCDIGLSSRDLKAEERESGLSTVVLAYDGIAFKYMAPAVFDVNQFEYIQNHLYAVLHQTFLVGVFDTQIENAATLMSQTLINNGSIQITQMHKTGRTGCNTGYLCTLGQLTFRITSLDLLRSGMNMREQHVR